MSLDVYGKPNCPTCKLACKRLDAMGIAYEYHDTEADPSARDHVASLGYMTVPVFETEAEHFAFGDKFRELVQTRRVA